jgi:phospholipid/cholesterol/gamma-HCH transport system substrate-binding protein
METRARYALIGLFMLAVILASFAFVYWLQHKGGFTQRDIYHVQFQSSVSGLLVGSAVLFNGIRVGDVTGLALNPDNPQQVIATIAVVRNTPIRADTQVGVESQGLAGGVALTLTGGTGSVPMPSGENGAPPTLVAAPGVGEDWTQTARDAFQQVDDMLAKNAKPLHETITNIKTFTDVLARNSDKVDGILAGIERLTGGGKSASEIPLYSLAAAKDLPPPPEQALSWQLVIPEPNTLMGFNTDKILTQPAADQSKPLDNAKWSDNLPILVQAKILQTFENAGYAQNVSRTRENFASNFQLILDIRRFHISTEQAPTAEINILARILDKDGKIIAARLFKESVPVSGSDAQADVNAFDVAFGKLQTDLLEWSVTQLNAAPLPPAPEAPPADEPSASPEDMPPPVTVEPPPADQPTR